MRRRVLPRRSNREVLAIESGTPAAGPHHGGQSSIPMRAPIRVPRRVTWRNRRPGHHRKGGQQNPFARERGPLLG
eukprot:520573-Lingulodinium_polyedra.AAC.1